MEKIACLVPTYNRYPDFGWLLEECVESFLRQTYSNKELLICNDTPGQTLKFDHPQVKIFNLSNRFPNLGSKITYMIENTDANIFARMDDDDCYMPWHLSQLMENMGGQLEWRPDSHLFLRQGRATLEHYPLNSHISGIFRREVLEIIGGYPYSRIGREDQDFNDLLREKGIHHKLFCLSLKNVSHIYRKHNIKHLSERRGLSREEFWEMKGKMPIVLGEFEIKPHWRQNYVKLVRRKRFI